MTVFQTTAFQEDAFQAAAFQAEDLVYGSISLRNVQKYLGTDASPALAKPTGLEVGDLMLLYVWVLTGSTLSITPPDGFSSAAVGDSADTYVQLFTKVADAADVAASTFTVATGDASNPKAAALAAFYEQAAASPVQDAGATAGGNSASPYGYPSITTATGAELLVAFWSSYGYVTWGSYLTHYQNPATWTEALDYRLSGNGSLAMAYGVAGGAGATDYWRATPSEGQYFGMAAVSLTPAPVAAPESTPDLFLDGVWG